jgi:hypothetical protein
MLEMRFEAGSRKVLGAICAGGFVSARVHLGQTPGGLETYPKKSSFASIATDINPAELTKTCRRTIVADTRAPFTTPRGEREVLDIRGISPGYLSVIVG